MFASRRPAALSAGIVFTLMAGVLLSATMLPSLAQTADDSAPATSPMTQSGDETSFGPGTYHSQDSADRTSVYIYSADYPPHEIAQHPLPPVKESAFFRELDREFQMASKLSLTPNVEEARYRVNLVCSGVLHCAKLQVIIMTPKRDVLSSYRLNGVRRGPFGLFMAPMPEVVKRLTQTLDEKIEGINTDATAN